MTFVDPGAIRRMRCKDAGSVHMQAYGRDRGRSSAPPSAAGRHNCSLWERS